MNEIKISVDFKSGTMKSEGISLISGDYKTTKLLFDFNEDYSSDRLVFEMKKPSGSLAMVENITGNEIVLVGKDNDGNDCPIFDEAGRYTFEISLYRDGGKLTSAPCALIVNKESVSLNGESATPYLPVFDELMKSVENINISASKEGNDATVIVADRRGVKTELHVYDGSDGKSAYEYAKDGGYAGAEAEFAEKLAQEQLIGTTNDLTPTQVYDAVSAGIPVKVQYTDSTFGLLSFTAFNVSESMNVIVANTIAYYEGFYFLGALYGDKTDNMWNFMTTALAQMSDIPATLPNPNYLTFTGAVTESYDGSYPVSVEIPSAVTDDYINSLIDAKLGVIENGSY